MTAKAEKGGIFAKLKSQIKSSVDKMSQKTLEALAMVQKYESKPIQSEPMRKLLEGGNVGSVPLPSENIDTEKDNIGNESRAAVPAPNTSTFRTPTKTPLTPSEPNNVLSKTFETPQKNGEENAFNFVKNDYENDNAKPIFHRQSSDVKRTLTTLPVLKATALVPEVNSLATINDRNSFHSEKSVSTRPIKRTTSSLDPGYSLYTRNKVRRSSERPLKELRRSLESEREDILPAILNEPPLAYRISQTALEAPEMGLEKQLVTKSNNSVSAADASSTKTQIPPLIHHENRLITTQPSIRPPAGKRESSHSQISANKPQMRPRSAAHRFRSYTQQPLSRLVPPTIKTANYATGTKNETSKNAAANAFKTAAVTKKQPQRSSANILSHIRPVNLSRAGSSVDASRHKAAVSQSLKGNSSVMAHSAAIKAAKAKSHKANTSLQSNSSFTMHYKPANTSSLLSDSVSVTGVHGKAPATVYKTATASNLSEPHTAAPSRKISTNHCYKPSGNQSFSNFHSRHSNLSNLSETNLLGSSNYLPSAEVTQAASKLGVLPNNFSHHKNMNPAIASTPVRTPNTRETGDGSVTQQDFGNFSNFSNFSFVASWAQTPELKKNTIAQRNINGKQIFGEVPPVDLDSLFRSEHESQKH